MEKSLNTIEDFLTDESFRSWVIDPTPELNDHWLTWLDENRDKLFLAEQARESISSLRFKEFSSAPGAKQRILEKIQKENATASYLSITRRTWWTIAALLLVLIGVALWNYSGINDQTDTQMVDVSALLIKKSNPLGQRSQYVLPDGSTVFLNAGSTIEYPATFPPESRIIKLDGEAILDVEHDPNRPFKVVGPDFEVVVLGTLFNVDTDADSPRVALLEGKVRLEAKTFNESLELSPDQMAILDKEEGTFIISPFDKRLVTGWKDGYLVFREASFEEVMEALQEWYGVKIRVVEPNPTEWSYSATFRQESLDNVLMSMQLLRRFDYKIKADSLILSF